MPIHKTTITTKIIY